MKGIGEGGHGQAVCRGFQRGEVLFRVVDLNKTLVGVDEPAKLTAVIEAVEDVAGDASGGLFGAEDFDSPVRLWALKVLAMLPSSLTGNRSHWNTATSETIERPPKAQCSSGNAQAIRFAFVTALMVVISSP